MPDELPKKRYLCSCKRRNHKDNPVVGLISGLRTGKIKFGQIWKEYVPRSPSGSIF